MIRYNIYSVELEAFLVMALKSRADAEKWRAKYLKAQKEYSMSGHLETLLITPYKVKGEL